MVMTLRMITMILMIIPPPFFERDYGIGGFRLFGLGCLGSEGLKFFQLGRAQPGFLVKLLMGHFVDVFRPYHKNRYYELKKSF